MIPYKNTPFKSCKQNGKALMKTRLQMRWKFFQGQSVAFFSKRRPHVRMPATETCRHAFWVLDLMRLFEAFSRPKQKSRVHV